MENLKKLGEDELKAVNLELNNLPLKNEIFKEINSFVNSAQKRIRSLSAILYLKAHKKNINENIINVLTAGELIHNASLLHDDVLDNAPLRRGRITIANRYTPQVSILSGDFLISIATEKLIKLQSWEIISFFQKCTQKMSEAEFQQYLLRGLKPSIDEYIAIAEGKTAELFEAIFMSSAFLTNLDVEKAKVLAKNFGILFQLKNDLEKNSAKIDAKNKIFTPKDILGIEKTHILIDNYVKEIKSNIKEIPDNIYKKGLEDLLQKV